MRPERGKATKSVKNAELTAKIEKEKCIKKQVKFKINLNEEQKEGKRVALEDGDVTVFLGGAGSGKSQPLHAKIKTRTGEVLMGNLKVGDYVLTEKNTEAKVLGIFPQGIEDVYEVRFSDGSNVECSMNHLWEGKVGEETERVYSLNEIDEIIKSGKKFSITTCSPISYIEKKVPVDPYIIGILISSGCLKTASFTTKELFIKNKIKKLISCDAVLRPVGTDEFIITNINANQQSRKESVFSVLKKFFCLEEGFGNYTSFADKLKPIGLFKKKKNNVFLPKHYMESSVHHRVSLLQGLMDGAGCVNPEDGSSSYYTNSSMLKSNIVELVSSLGGVCRCDIIIDDSEVKLSTVCPVYKITISLQGFNIFTLPKKSVLVNDNFRLEREVVDIVYKGSFETQCIYIDSEKHLYLTNNYIVTHNTMLACQIALDRLFKKECKKIVIARPAVEAGENLGFMPGDVKDKLDHYLQPVYDNMYQLIGKETIDKLIGEGTIEIIPFAFMRGRTLTDTAIILDEIQNCSQKQIELALGRIGKGSITMLCGDAIQSDLKACEKTSIKYLNFLSKTLKKVNVFVLKANHRHGIVKEILNATKKYNEDKEA